LLCRDVLHADPLAKDLDAWRWSIAQLSGRECRGAVDRSGTTDTHQKPTLIERGGRVGRRLRGGQPWRHEIRRDHRGGEKSSHRSFVEECAEIS